MHKNRLRICLVGLLLALTIAGGWATGRYSASLDSAVTAGSKGDQFSGRESNLAGSKGLETFGRVSSIAGSKGAETFGRESS